MIETLQEIDNVVLNFSSEGKHMLNLTIAFIMFGVALELDLDDFRKLFQSPKPAIVGIVSQFILMPLLTFLLAMGFQSFITPTIGLGMVLVASCPGGNISNFMSSVAKGNVALSVSLTAFSSIACIILTPFNFAFWGGLYMEYGTAAAASELVRSLNIDVWEVLQTIVIILGIPLVLGVLTHRKLPKLTKRILMPIKRLSIFAFLAIIVIIFTKNFDLFLTYIQYIFFIVLIHNALALAMGYFFAKSTGLEHKTRKTVAIETGIQNSGLALALLFNPDLFPPGLAVGGMTFISAWWGVWHIISGLTMAGIWSGFSLKPNSSDGAPATE